MYELFGSVKMVSAPEIVKVVDWEQPLKGVGVGVGV